MFKELQFMVRQGDKIIRPKSTLLRMTSSCSGDKEEAERTIQQFVNSTDPDELSVQGYGVTDQYGHVQDAVLVWHAKWEHGSPTTPQLVETSRN